MLAEHVKAPPPDPTQWRYTHRDGIVAVGNDVSMTGAGGRATESEAAGGGQLG